jgi:hypothetical protein
LDDQEDSSKRASSSRVLLKSLGNPLITLGIKEPVLSLGIRKERGP